MHTSDHSELIPARTLSLQLENETATIALAQVVARTLSPGFLLYLSGELGSGKTTLVRGLLRALGYPGRVKSPTYALVELYVVSKLNLYHFDFYRFRDPKEWDEAGFREYFDGSSICIVEWPEKAMGLLPPPDLEIHLETEQTPRSGRIARLSALTESGALCVSALKSPADSS